MTDQERSERKLHAVEVCSDNDGGEYYEVGKNGITAIKWDWTSGHMAALQTVTVYKNGKLHSEHCFSNVLGVYYATEEPNNAD